MTKSAASYLGKSILAGLSWYIEKLVIGELNMYWNGFYALGAIAAGKYFNVKKPIMFVGISSAGISILSYSYVNQSSNTTSGSSLQIGTSGNYYKLNPGQYLVTANNIASFTIVGAEGITALNAGNISQVIEIL
jgi:hypothetical protein